MSIDKTSMSTRVILEFIDNSKSVLLRISMESLWCSPISVTFAVLIHRRPDSRRIILLKRKIKRYNIGILRAADEP